jgi:CheY-like chemotaxis protein
MEPSSIKICIADDEPHLRQLLQAMLSADGYTFVTAADGDEAIATTILETPDLVLLDIMMPKRTATRFAAGSAPMRRWAMCRSSC